MKLHKANLFFCLHLIFLSLQTHCTDSWRVTILGTGYVGLVTGVCLACWGHEVTCVDTDIQKIEQLQNRNLTFYEPNLEPLFLSTLENGLLTFTTDASQAIKNSDILMIAVGTPGQADGSVDTRALDSVITTLAQNLTTFKLICIKSTVPIGTAHSIIKKMDSYGIARDQYALVSCPEFLREGSAVHDFFQPDRVIMGTDSEKAQQMMHSLFESLRKKDIPFIYTDFITAETIKYASNAFLATKISFINEMANFCDVMGADVLKVAYAMGLDKRIGTASLRPGPGFGGSCFPKDCVALQTMACKYDVPLGIIQSVLVCNELQKRKPVEKLKKLLNRPLQDTTIALLGLSFKANTDDIRSSPALTAIEMLLAENAHIKMYDPVAMPHMRLQYPDLTYCTSAYDALIDADACIILTEWPEFKDLSLSKIKSLMKSPYIIDARNILDIQKLHELGFMCDTIGRSVLCQPTVK